MYIKHFYKMAVKQNRIVRFLMVITVVLLTIFIYASYYSNPAMTIPLRMHTAAFVSTLTDNTSGLVKNSPNNLIVVVDKQNSEKLQSNSELETNTSFIQQQYLDVAGSFSLPISMQKNFDTNFTKNVSTSTSSTTTNSSSSHTLHNIKQTNLTSTGGFASAGGGALPSSELGVSRSVAENRGGSHAHNSGSLGAVSSQSRISGSLPVSAASSRHPLAPVDPLKGVRTSTIYEGGSLDVNPQLCPDEGDQLRLFIAITSAPSHREARLAIRQTWGHFGVRRDVAIAFILGKTNNQGMEDILAAENFMYGDLIRGHFIDSYNNLTLKTISILEWVDKNCPHVAFVLKTDDDMFINVPKLLAFIEKHHNEKRTIYGRLAKKWKPNRNKKSKYYVSQGQFGATVFPQFTTGPAYLMTSDIIHDLYLKSLEQTYVRLEDVFTTGIVAQQLNIKRAHVNEFLNRRIAFNPFNIRKAISVHMVKSNEQFDLWKKLLDTSTKTK